MPPFSKALPLFIQWKTAVWALVSLPSNQELLHFVHPLSVWRKMQLPGLLTPGQVARSLPADYSYFHKLFLCVSALGCGSMSFWSLRHNSSFAGPGSMLLLDVCTVIYQDQTTVGVSGNFSAIPKEPLTLYRPTQATEEPSAHLKRQLLITGGIKHRTWTELWKQIPRLTEEADDFVSECIPKCFLLLVKTHFDGTLKWTIFHTCLYISVVHTAR